MADSNATNYKISQAVAGLNTDSTISQMREGQMTFAKNAVVENFDGNMITYQNEQSNEFCLSFKEGFRVIGQRNIVEQNKTIFMLVNTTTGESEIGQRMNDSCEYTTIISSPCLNFNINYPIHKIVVKTTNCSTQIFWTDGYNPRRWMDLDELPWREEPNPENENQPIKIIGEVDCNKLLVQPNFSIPIIKPEEEEVGGQIIMGAYQFSVQYANSLGEGYTSFYGTTNPMGIFESKVTPDFNLPTTKAISLQINNLDTSGLYDYFNLVVIKTVNNISSVELVGTYAINGRSTFDTVYTGAENSQSSIRFSMNDIFERFPYYDVAQDVTTTDNTLLWLNLTSAQKAIHQKIWSKVKLYWETWIVPYTKFEAYNNAINTSELRGYMRDEPYALEACFILKNGRIVEAGSLIGREATPFDREIVTNPDALNTAQDVCDEPLSKQRWEVYNTGSVIDFCDEYKNAKDKSCYVGPYQYGEFAYWESTQKYPINIDVWGDLSGQPIRHPKFPDCIISPIHSNNDTDDPAFKYSIFPIGIRVDMQSLYNAIQNSDLTQEEKDQIAGFKILRGNRATNKSVVAKGLLYNVGQYEFEGQNYLYPNYPFNDLNPDVFISSTPVNDHSGDNAGTRLVGFGENSKSRFTFHSPDTHFYQPFSVDSGYLKLETVEYGQSRGHFVPVKENAEYKFLTRQSVAIALAAGASSIVGLQGGFAGFSSGVQVHVDLSSVMPVFQTTLELLKNITPDVNYGYNFNSIGIYGSSAPVPNNVGTKNRVIEFGEYLRGASTSEPVGDIYPLNNYNRESSVYIKVGSSLPFPHEVSSVVPEDNSRFTISQNECSPQKVSNRDISAYYGAIKRVFPDQWGRIFSYETIDTGFYSNLYQNDGSKYSRTPTVFGGDIFINRFALKRKLPFFIDHTVGRPDGADINLDDLGNVGYPIYYYSTKPVDIDTEFPNIVQESVDILTGTDAGNIILNLLTAGTKPFIAGLIVVNYILGLYVRAIGVPNVNLDCEDTLQLNEIGYAYLFAYGIPYFFVESEVNVDYRQAYNDREGDFFPHVSTDIPDDWVQEINVPIRQDNTYTYNRGYSKQNKETFFPHLREDFDPSKLCFTEFPNRVIYSQKANLEETKNNWLVYRPASYFDFPKNYGPVNAIDGLEDRKLLVRFDNKSLLYNVYATIDTSIQAAYIGDPTFFSQPPVDFAETDLGYNGSQNKFILRTEAGHVTTDSKRGQIFMYRGNQIEELSNKGMEKFFTENLAFAIKDYFPAVNTDNHFKDFGITGVYDPVYKRIIITKKDYIPLNPDVKYNSEQQYFYIVEGTPISVDNSEYFCNLSWTLSYCLSIGAWISFHSYVPNYYVGHPGFFDTGIETGLYSHNKSLTFQNFYGKLEDYVLEYPLSFVPDEEIIGSVSGYTTILKYQTKDVYIEPEDGIYFNQAYISNNQQCTGLLDLVFKPRNNLASYMRYPKLKESSKEIMVTKSDNIFSFNQFWDIVKDPTKPFFSRPCNIPSLDRILDNTNLDYSRKSHTKTKMRSKEARIRLIQNATSAYKLISKFTLTETQKSFK